MEFWMICCESAELWIQCRGTGLVEETEPMFLIYLTSETSSTTFSSHSTWCQNQQTILTSHSTDTYSALDFFMLDVLISWPCADQLCEDSNGQTIIGISETTTSMVSQHKLGYCLSRAVRHSIILNSKILELRLRYSLVRGCRSSHDVRTISTNQY